MHFWSFWAKYCHLLHILSNARQKNNVNKVPRWVFRYVGNKAYDFSSKKKDFFFPKTTKFGPKLAFLVNLGQCPVGGSVGGCGARAVSRKTPIYFIKYITINILIDVNPLKDITWTTWLHKLPVSEGEGNSWFWASSKIRSGNGMILFFARDQENITTSFLFAMFYLEVWDACFCDAPALILFCNAHEWYKMLKQVQGRQETIWI